MKFSSIYPNFEEDLLREVSLQKVALRAIRLRVNHQLTQEEFAAKLDVKRAYLARLEAGHHMRLRLSSKKRHFKILIDCIVINTIKVRSSN